MTDPIADLLTRIRNGLKARQPAVVVPHSRLKERIAQILKSEGYLGEIETEDQPRKNLKIKLKYDGQRAVIEGLRRISRPGLRHYVAATDAPRVRGGLGIAILSTSQGVMTASQARKQNLGGEVLCHVW
ncbi:MAG: 30S ribosomal protein S8 [Verrucomicrobia bacterium]|nr:30S ribosomal protein S8 [Verrucomicrobiota bacterium]